MDLPSIELLFQKYLAEEKVLIQLLDKSGTVIGAISPESIILEDIHLLAGHTSEKYCLWYRGISVLFSAWRKYQIN